MSRSDVDDSAIDFLGYGIKDPRNYKVVASSPRMVVALENRWFWQRTINETEFVSSGSKYYSFLQSMAEEPK
jgi:hypothetical protein